MAIESQNRKGWDWKTWFGLVLTASWLLGGGYYLAVQVGWKNFCTLQPNEIGDTLAGFAAPLAFLWLVLGYLLQRDELKLQRKEVARLGDEYGKQRQATEANELHARRDTFFRFLELALVDLNYFSARIISSFGIAESVLWQSMSLGDKNALFHNAVGLIKNEHAEDIKRGFSGKKVLADRLAPEAQRLAIERFTSLAEKVLVDAGRADKELRRQLEHSPLGSLLAVLCKFNGQPIPFEHREKPREMHEIV